MYNIDKFIAAYDAVVAVPMGYDQGDDIANGQIHPTTEHRQKIHYSSASYHDKGDEVKKTERNY